MTLVKRYFNPVGLLVLLGGAIAFPFVVADPTYTTIGIFALIFAGFASGWNIFSGYTGYIALGHTAYFGIGAYALAIICNHYNVPAGWEPLWLVPLCGLVAGVFAIPSGAIALRARRHTFVVITIAMFFIAQLMAYNLRGVTNGSAGLDLPIPFQWDPLNQGGNLNAYNLPFYFAALAVTLLALAVSWFVRNSKYGLGLLAIRDDEDRARGLGVRTEAAKLSAFVISAIFAGMMGAIFAYFNGSVAPSVDFDALFDVAVALMVFMGGIGTLTGPILGALVLESAKEYFASSFTAGNGGWYLVAYGALFLAVILLMPQGVVPSLRNLWAKWQISGHIGPVPLPETLKSAPSSAPPLSVAEREEATA